MTDVNPLDRHKLEVAALLESLAESLADRRAGQPVHRIENWAKSMQEEILPPLIVDELNQIYKRLSQLSHFSQFTNTERAIVSSIQQICRQYDDIQKLW
ncbi:MAG: hypothetical protein JXR76_07540 [Deltaproteobacteria bacterium]|nr:hypothetical protein [Deltaproteobacteria bacterium]